MAAIETGSGGYAEPWWTVGSLAPGGEATLTVRLAVDADAQPGPDVLKISAQATAPGDPLVHRIDDQASEATSLELDTAPAPSIDSEDPERLDSSVDGAAKVSELLFLELEYRVRLSDYSYLGIPCRPYHRGAVAVVARGFLKGAATLVNEPYPVPIEVIFFTELPDDCESVSYYYCGGDFEDAALVIAATCGLGHDRQPNVYS